MYSAKRQASKIARRNEKVILELGKRYNYLTILSLDKFDGSIPKFFCKCDCGVIKSIRLPRMRNGTSKSCGCKRVEAVIKRKTTHGMSGTREYAVWQHMIDRCENVNCEFYYRYGGRGITICPEWRNDFATFYRDMGPAPIGLSLDRINNDKGYYKENCKWATLHEQLNNTGRSRWLTFNGESYPLLIWSQMLGVTHSCLQYRLKHWPIERALTTGSKYHK